MVGVDVAVVSPDTLVFFLGEPSAAKRTAFSVTFLSLRAFFCGESHVRREDSLRTDLPLLAIALFFFFFLDEARENTDADALIFRIDDLGNAGLLLRLRTATPCC